jgi:hypothetical protein
MDFMGIKKIYTDFKNKNLPYSKMHLQQAISISDYLGIFALLPLLQKWLVILHGNTVVNSAFFTMKVNIFEINVKFCFF